MVDEARDETETESPWARRFVNWTQRSAEHENLRPALTGWAASQLAD